MAASVTYHGHVAGLGAGSGSAFALLPPQNASGNWIKIVQRVPVRIALDPEGAAIIRCASACRSMSSVDVRDTSGSPWSRPRRPARHARRHRRRPGRRAIALIAEILGRMSAAAERQCRGMSGRQPKPPP
jgi:membrane fusion protein (multidrug efflux system)